MRYAARILALSMLVTSAFPAVARADEADRGQARELGTKAYEAAQRGDWARAEDLFKRADTLYHAPTLLLGLARARAHLGKYVEAWEDYHRILIETLPPNASAALRQAVEDAKAEIGSIAGKRAHAIINVTGASHPTVTLDGVTVSEAALGTERAVNPGTHALHVEAPGFKPADTTFTVSEGGETTTSVALEPQPPADASIAPTSSGVSAQPPAAPAAAAAGTSPDTTTTSGGTTRTLGIVGMGVGAAGLVVGAVTGFMAIGKHGSLQSSPCASAGCSPADLASYQSDTSTYHSLGAVSTISLVAGGVLAAGGAVLFFTAPKAQGTTAASRGWVSPYAGPLSAGVAGAF